MLRLKSIFKVFSVVFILSSCSSGVDAVYIDIQKVFEGFELKKELSVEFKAIEAKRQGHIDSLSMDLKNLYLKIEQTSKRNRADLILVYQKKEKSYYDLSEDFKQKNRVLMNDYDIQILQKINEYVKVFGEENDYDMIIGANNSGNVMYSKTHLDISEEVIMFINSKYKGE
jgi:outer membrane protein